LGNVCDSFLMKIVSFHAPSTGTESRYINNVWYIIDEHHHKEHLGYSYMLETSASVLPLCQTFIIKVPVVNFDVNGIGAAPVRMIGRMNE
jgi:hypothetical protein